MPSNGGSDGRPAGSASPTGRIPQDRSRVPTQRSGDTAISSPSISRVPDQVPTWANRCASRVTRLPARITCGCSWSTSKDPSQVRSRPIPSVSSRVIRIFSQRVDDLEPVAVDVLVQTVVVDRVTEVDGGLLVPSPDEHEGVLGAEVGVVADAGDQEDLAAAVVGVEVGPVVEVAVAGAGPGHRAARTWWSGYSSSGPTIVRHPPSRAGSPAAACCASASRCRRAARSRRSGSGAHRCA